MNIGGSSDANNADKSASGTPSVNILPGKDAKVSIYMSSDTQNEITGPTKMFSTDKMVRVTSGDSEIEIEGSTAKISIETLSELAYLGKITDLQTFELINGYVWMEAPNGDLGLNLKFFQAKFAPGSVIIASQNTRASNLYVLRGEAEVKTEGGSARVASGQMISLLQSETKNSNLADKIGALDDFVKQSSIFKRKNGDALLATPDTTMNSSGAIVGTSSGSITTGSEIGAKAIVVSYPEDEQEVDTEKITIEGTISNPNVRKITFGKMEAKITTDGKAFSVKDYVLTEEMNDINYRVYDESGVQLEKDVITVKLTKKSVTQKKPDVVSYPVSSKDFKILSPAENPFKTTDSSVKIRGSFAPDLVKFIKVNNYQLQQFRQFGTSWTYNASIDNGNMEEGVNEYLITYYGTNDDVLYTSKIYIVKEKVAPVTVPGAETPTTGSTTPGTTGTTTTGSGSSSNL